MMSAGAPSPTVASDQSHESFGASRPSIVTAWLFPAKPAANCFANLWAKASPAAAVIGILACGGVRKGSLCQARAARRGQRQSAWSHKRSYRSCPGRGLPDNRDIIVRGAVQLCLVYGGDAGATSERVCRSEASCQLNLYGC